MASTLLLDTVTWDLVLDVNGNIAVAAEPYSQAQDAASAIKVFEGEEWYDTTQGIPYFSQILGRIPSLGALKAALANRALIVPGVVKATTFITGFINRAVSGQVQITNSSGDQSAASF